MVSITFILASYSMEVHVAQHTMLPCACTPDNTRQHPSQQDTCNAAAIAKRFTDVTLFRVETGAKSAQIKAT